MALTILKEADFRKALKTAPTGGYLFFGEEDYMKSAAIRMARQSVTEADPAIRSISFSAQNLNGEELMTPQSDRSSYLY